MTKDDIVVGLDDSDPARVLLALGCFAAGFACFEIIDDPDLMVSAGVVVVAAVVGLITLRSAAFYLPSWLGAMGFVTAFVQNGLDLTEGDALAYWMAGGFLLVGLVLVVAGIFLGRQVAWTLAGLSGWAATIPLVSFDHSYLALAIATLVAGALFRGGHPAQDVQLRHCGLPDRVEHVAGGALPDPGYRPRRGPRPGGCRLRSDRLRCRARAAAAPCSLNWQRAASLSDATSTLSGTAGPAPPATHEVSSWSTLPVSTNAAMTDGMHPRWPTTCCCAGIGHWRGPRRSGDHLPGPRPRPASTAQASRRFVRVSTTSAQYPRLQRGRR